MPLACVLACTLLAAPALAQQANPAPQANSTQQPTPAPPPALPDPARLMLEVERHQLASEAATRDYTYKVHIENFENTKSGELKKSHTTDADSLTVNGVRINKVFARDGKPLTGDEKQKEDERVDKQIEKAKDRRDKKEAKGEATDARGDDLLTVSRILQLGTFSNVHPDIFGGRPVWVMDYLGDRNAKTRSTFENAVKDLSGTVWIDQADHVLVAAKGTFNADFKVGGGLLMNLHKGTSFQFRSVKVDNAVWLPDTVEARGGLRYMLFVNFNGGFRLHASDYRKFRSTSRVLSLDEANTPAPVPAKQP